MKLTDFKEYFKDYLIEVDDDDLLYENNHASSNLNNYIDGQLKVFINCTVIKDGGFRPMTTIDNRYKREIVQMIYVMEQHSDEINVEEWCDKIVKQHEKNIEFEKENPPERLTNRIKRAKEVSERKSRRKRQTSLFGNDDKAYREEIKKDKARKKEEEKKVKITFNMFTFNG